MEELVLAGVAAAGVAVGLGAGLGFRWSERTLRVPAEPPEPALPPGTEAVLAVLSSPAVIVDAQLRVLRASPATYALGLVKGAALTNRELAALTEQVHRDGRIRQTDLTLQRGRSAQLALHVHARLAPLTSELVLILVEDRTEAYRLDEVRRDFVANVSHELKTPVGAISLLSEAVQGASDDPEAVERFAGRMQAESVRLSRLVQEIIDLSRLQYDDPLVSPEPVSIDELVEEVLDQHRIDAEARHVRLMSGGDAGLVVLGNRSQLNMALGNLVSNAIAYSGERTRVAIGIRKLDDAVELSVTDQGIGIARPDVERIFERFYRVDQARSRATGGTGLGLSIVKHVVAAHGGEIAVWSVLGTGSTFTVLVPLHRSTPGQPPRVPDAIAAGEPLALESNAAIRRPDARGPNTRTPDARTPDPRRARP